MKTTTLFNPAKPFDYFKIGFLIFLLGFALKFVIRDVIPYYELSDTAFGRFLNIKWWLVGHITGGLLAILIGPLQFWKGFRNKYINTHRLLGKIYLVGIIIASLCSTYLAWTSALAIHWTWSISLQVGSVFWITSALMAYLTIRQKRVQRHKEWMIRSYVLTFSFALFRWVNELPFVIELGNFIERGPTIGWMVFIIPFFIAEVIMDFYRK